LQPIVGGRTLSPMAGVRWQAPVRMRAIFIVFVAAVALMCLGGLPGSAMAMMDGQGCSGSECDRQIAASRLFQFQAHSGLVGDFQAVLAAVGLDLPLTHDGPLAVAPPRVRQGRPSLAPFAPRSPPVA